LSYTLQVAPEDCTGCSLCVEVCPARSKQDPQRKALNLAPMADRRESDSAAFEYFLTIPDPDRRQIKAEVKSIQFQPPLFEFSGACAGCGETPYVKLLTQMYGDRLFVANATGCSSIYGGNLPTTPWCSDQNGRGPAWSNSLFEDNAEYGFGQRFAIDAQHDFACLLIQKLAPQIGDELVQQLLHADQSTEEGIAAQRQRVLELRARLRPLISPEAQRLVWVANALVRKSVWILGGDGWAYDIGYGGLDHVLALNSKVNILVLDTEVYSNTGGQSSKSTPMGATAKFAAAGKRSGKKDLAWMAMSYGHAYVASIALGARDSQTVKVFAEAESYPGTSLILAYSPCIAHGYPLQQGLDQQKRAVDSGYWPLFRFDPRRTEQGEPALKLDSGAPKIPLSEYLSRELRFQMLHTGDPVAAAALQTEAQQRVNERYRRYAAMAEDRPLAV
jgi:pyruvate-ferredoxin/flavodoxin oxidoreductase